MILLDTDHITIYRLGEHPPALTLQERLRSAHDTVATTAVTLEEQMRGWLEEIGRKRDVRQQVPHYGELTDLIRFFHDWTMVPFDVPSAKRFLQLRKQRVRIGTPDLKIASIALVNDALLLSANLRDFGKVPGLSVENWLR